MNNERIKQAYINGFIKAAGGRIPWPSGAVDDGTLAVREWLARQGATQAAPAASQTILGGLGSKVHSAGNTAGKWLSEHPKSAIGIGAGGGIAGNAIGLGLLTGDEPAAAPSASAEGPSATSPSAEPGVMDKLLESINAHPYLWGGGAAAGGAGLGYLLSNKKKETEEQPSQVPTAPAMG